MRLTPRDIQEKEFSSGFRGYKEEEVDSFLDEVTEAYEAVFKENLDLREEVEKLREECKKYETIGERMQGALVAAQETADDVRKNAQKESENIVREAELKAQKLIQETKDKHLDLQKQLASLKQVEEEFRFKLKSLLQSYLKLVEELPFGERKEVKDALSSIEEVERLGVATTAPMEIKEEVKEEPKEEVKEEPKEEVKEKPKEEVKEEAKEEAKEEPKEKVKEEAKEEIKAEVPIPFNLEEGEKPSVRKLAPKEAKAAEEAAKPAKGRTAKKAKAEKKEEEKAKKPEEKEEAKKAEEEPSPVAETSVSEEEIEIIEDETFWKDT